MRVNPVFSCDLSTEELAVVIGIAGRPEIAKGLLSSSFGEISVDEERGRLLAAHNSLLARKLIHLEAGQPQLHPEFKKTMAAFLVGRRLVRAGRTGLFGEDMLAYYHHADGWLGHGIRDGVSHHLDFPFSLDRAEAAVEAFLSPVCPPLANSIRIALPDTLLTELSPEARRSYDDVLEVIRSVSPSNPAAQLLAQDFAEGPWRGSTTWMDQTDPNSVLTRGMLWLQGVERLWMITAQAREEAAQSQAVLCGRDQFRAEVHGLFLTRLEPNRTQ